MTIIVLHRPMYPGMEGPYGGGSVLSGSKDKKVLIMVGDAPYQGLRPYTALRFAEAAAKRGAETRLVYFGDGVHCVRRGVGRGSTTVADYEQKVLSLLEQGIAVEACSAPMRLYKLEAEDLIEGVTVAEEMMDRILDNDTEVIWL